MLLNFASNSSPFFKLIITLLISLVVFMVVSIIAFIIAIPVFGIDLLSLEQHVNPLAPENISLLKFLQIAQSIGLFVVPALLCGYLFYTNNPDKFGLFSHKKPETGLLLLSIVLVVFAFPVINSLGEWNSNLHLPEQLKAIENWMLETEEKAQNLSKAFLKVSTLQGLLLNIFMIAILPAIGEEFLFRGIIQRILIEWTRNYHIGIWIAALLFSALHMQFYGFVPRLVLGVLFGYGFYWGKNIWYPVMAHFINNGVAVITFYYIYKGNLPEETESIGAENPTIAIISAILVIVTLITFKLRGSKTSSLQQL